jgi:uncharacterized paraquat-inducible protein A
MDIGVIEQLVCSDCGLVYGEPLIFSAHEHVAATCPRCGACDGSVSSLDCVYGTAQASLIRF